MFTTCPPPRTVDSRSSGIAIFVSAHVPNTLTSIVLRKISSVSASRSR
jgi:hypothetical protein